MVVIAARVFLLRKDLQCSLYDPASQNCQEMVALAWAAKLEQLGSQRT